MSKDPLQPKALNVCSNCGRRNVVVRRPSTTGHHWCKDAECQRAKSRHYYVQRGLDQKARLDQVRLDFLRAALNERATCSGCGLENAVVGYPHPTSEGQPCFELGSGGRGVLTTAWIDVAMPPETRAWSLL